MADWLSLPKDLLERISGRFETCFEIVHFRSVCGSWRLAVSPASYRRDLGFNSHLPIFNHDPRFEGDTHCQLKKIPAFLLRFQTPFGADYLLVGMKQSKSGKQKLLLPLTGFCFAPKYGIILNTLSSQIIPLGYYYKIKFFALTTIHARTRRQSLSIRVAFLPLDGEDGRDFVVVAVVFGDLMMYRSCDKKWIKLEGRFRLCRDVVSFKGKFYVVDWGGRGHVFVIEPSLEVSEILSVTKSHESSSDERLVVSREEELLLVQRFTPGEYGRDYMHTWFRLFRLEEEEGKRRWVRINDLEDRVVFLGYEHDWNLCYSAKELPGMKRNCVMSIDSDADRIRVFDLGTKRTHKASEWIGCTGAFGENLESLVLCGILALPNPTMSISDESD